MKKHPTRVRRRLFDHQVDALNYLRESEDPFGALFMEMRLGKTLVIIRFILWLVRRGLKRPLRVLVVAPGEALYSWEKELKLEGETDFVYLTGKRDHRIRLLNERHTWNLFNIEGHRAVPEIAQPTHRWTAVVLDESTSIKNPRSQVSRFYCRHFREVPYRFILTGTPMPEGLLDVYQQFRFLDVGPVFDTMSYWQFRARNFLPERGGYHWGVMSGRDKTIREEIARRSFIRTRRQAGMDRRRIYEQRLITMPKSVRRAYSTAEREFILELDGIESGRTKFATVKYNWLRRICGGFIGTEVVWDGKLVELVRLLTGELKNEQIVVWFNYNAEVAYVYQWLKAAGYSVSRMTGKIPRDKRKRRDRLLRFDSGKIQVLLLQWKIARFSVDLSAASAAIYYSTPLGREARMQTEDRILSPVKRGPLLYIDLLVDNSVDWDLFGLLERKEARSVNVMDACAKIRERLEL